MRQSSFAWPWPLLAAVSSATFGGFVFWLAHLPMPWLLGAIIGTAVATMAGVQARIPNGLRDVVLVILGLMIGADLQPSIVHDLARWPISLAAVVVYVVVVTSAQYYFFRRIGGYDPPTAYFSAAPGGFMAMTVIGRDFGGTERIIAMMHSIRIVVVVFVLVLGINWFVGSNSLAPANHYITLLDIPLSHWLILTTVGVIGAAITKALKLPGAAMIGPLVAMGIVQVSGLTSIQVPSGPIVVAEVILGSSIGAQFAGTGMAELRRGLALSLASTLALLVISMLFAAGLQMVTGFGLAPLFLALSPGGMSGISLVALALGIEPAFVAAHNMLRILVILSIGPLAFSAYRQ